MEQFVLGIFQEQLSKIIIGFRKEQINANILNGKGEITDVSLNCSFINEAVRKISPFLEFEEIHVSRLGFHVTSWANLRKAPIVVDIGIVTAVLQEPLQCLPKAQRRRLQIVTERQLVQLLLEGLYKPMRGNGSYGFADRIVDNLTIEIETLRLSFQTWGKFKTRRAGPWKPPLLLLEVHHLRVTSVDQHGYEASPDQVWAHNRHRMKEFLMHKKLTGEINVNVISNHADESTQTVNFIKKMKFEVQAAVKRRLRDGAVLGIQSDLTIPSIKIDIEASDIPLLAHWVTAVQYCFAKDRSFEDPLKSETSPASEGLTDGRATATEEVGAEVQVGDEEEYGEEDEEDADEESEGSVANESIDNESIVSDDDDTDTKDRGPEIKQNPSHGSVHAPYKHRPLILLPNGLVIYENICFTCSVHSVSIRGLYGKNKDGFVQTTAKGCIGELIWPKTDNTPGVYFQSSVAFMSVQERLDRRIQTILIGGIVHEDHQSIHKPSKTPREVHADENFPLFERRSIREDPLDLRHSFPSQAFGAKSTIDIQPPKNDEQQYMALHEVGIDEFDIILDAESWCRAIRFFLHEDGGGYDARWNSGDWTELLTQDMLIDPTAALDLDDHLQHVKQLFLDDNFMISSDRLNVTARFSNIEIRMPAAVEDNVRSCDILVQVNETTLVVSSALPRTFLSGKIGNSISGDALKKKGGIDFPNDPSDIAYSLEGAEDPSLRLSGVELSRNVSTFRLQLTVRGFQIRLIPVIPFCNASEPQQLIAPMGMTMIACFEGEPPGPGSSFMKVALFVSLHVHNFALNIDLDLLAGSLCSVLHQKDVLEDTIEMISELLPPAPLVQAVGSDVAGPNTTEAKIKKNLKGRRVMVRRHLARSRETGGLGVVFCLQVSEGAIVFWRQNVPYSSPLRHPGNGFHVPNESSHEHHIPLLKLVDTRFKEFEIGIEFDFQANQSRRTIVKFCLLQGRVLICDVGKEVQKQPIDPTGSRFSPESKSDYRWEMVELMTFGTNSLPGDLEGAAPDKNQDLAVRLEEQVTNGARSWSLAADLKCPTAVNACIESVKDTIILFIEALLLPSWSKRDFPTIEGAPFPDKSIGAMFISVCIPSGVWHKNIGLLEENDQFSRRETFADPIVERALRTLSQLLLPSDMQLVLLRLEIANLLLSIPSNDIKAEEKNLGMHMMQTDLVIRFYPVPGSEVGEMEDILACKGVPWSSLIQSKEKGYYQKISSRQSLLSISTTEDGGHVDHLVHPFNIALTYDAATVHLAMDEDLKISDIRRIESFVDGLKDLQNRTKIFQSEVLAFLAAIRQPATADTTNFIIAQDKPYHESKSVDTDVAVKESKDTRQNSARTRLMLQSVHTELGHYEKDLRNVLKQKEEELRALTRKVFEKEKHRFAALALMSSRVAGWIRMGGVHKTGQRVSRKSTLWPFWAVLRKDLMILYSSPGEPRPSDVVVLRGAKVRQLAGGNRQDTKRGFAIIERDGMTRYFVTATVQEFSLWVREISAIVEMHRNIPCDTSERDPNIRTVIDGEQNQNNRAMEVETTNTANHPSEYGEASDEGGVEAPERRPGRIGNRFAGAKNRLGAALETARQKGKKMSDRRRDASSRGEFESELGDYVDTEEETTQATPTDGSDEIRDTTVTVESENINQLENMEESGPLSDERTDEGTKRRLQFGKAFSGMGQGTKSRLGSVLQSARQKGADAATRRGTNAGASETPPRPLSSIRGQSKELSPGPRNNNITVAEPVGNRRTSSSFGSDPRYASDSRSESWTCDACTFITAGGDSCEMCGTDRSPVDVDEATCDEEKKVSCTGENGVSLLQTFEDAPDATTLQGMTSRDVDGSRRGRFGKIGAAVRSVRQNSGSSLDDNQEGRNRPMSSRFRRGNSNMTTNESIFEETAITLKKIHAGGNAPMLGEEIDCDVPLKVFEGNWAVSVKARTQQVAPVESNTIDEYQSTLSGIGTANEEPQVSDGFMPVSETCKPYHGQVSPTESCTKISGFTIVVTNCSSANSIATLEKECHFSELLGLHVTVSEMVEQMLPQLWRVYPSEIDRAEESADSKVDSHDPVENVLNTGRLLGGFLEVEENCAVMEKTRDYQAEIIESFLNSLLRCPLPVDALSAVSEFLGMAAASKNAHIRHSRDVDTSVNVAQRTEVKSQHEDAREESGIFKSNENVNSNRNSLLLGRPEKIFSLLTACETELLRVETAHVAHSGSCEGVDTSETQKKVELPVEEGKGQSTHRSIDPGVYEPLLPPSVSDHIQDAMHEALVNVMAERDEAHAQLIASNVLHVHDLEQERRKNDRLRIEKEVKEEMRRLQQPNVGSFFQNMNDDRDRRQLRAKLESFEKILGNNTDEELCEICRQLSGEISAKTAHALEIVRLKETRAMERRNEAAEKKALKDELRRVKSLLVDEQRNCIEEAGHGKNLSKKATRREN